MPDTHCRDLKMTPTKTNTLLEGQHCTSCSRWYTLAPKVSAPQFDAVTALEPNQKG